MNWDVVVWGGGTGGVAAAIQASRCGAQTLLLTPGPWLGGMLSAAGVCAPDGHELSCWQTGLWGQFIRTLSRSVPEGLDQNWVSCFGFRPEQAEQLLQHWVNEESSLCWWSNCVLQDVIRRGERIASVLVNHQGRTKPLEGRQWIDGSDLGDLIAMSDAPYRWGWEASELWDEPSAPSEQKLKDDPFFQDQPIQSPTWVVMGQLHDQHRHPDQWNQPLNPPFQHADQAFGLERTITYGRLPGGLVMLNWPLDGNDWHRGLDRCIDPSVQQRERLHQEMQHHSLHFLYELQRCSDGWVQTGAAFPSATPQLALMPYWREGRRLQGRAVVTERDLLPETAEARRSPIHPDSIAVGTYANDHHYPGEDWPLAPKSCRWGGRWTGTPFCIPYQSLLSDSVTNLLAAEKCFSVSHMANGATRLQPLILNIGQAAGLAASLAVRRGVDPGVIPAQDIQQKLIDDPIAPAAVLPIWDWPAWHPHWRSAQRRGLQNIDAVTLDGSLSQSQQTGLIQATTDETPLERRAQRIRGRLFHEINGGYRLDGPRGSLALITLEPAVEHGLRRIENRTQVDLIAVENPWGPWWRVIRIPDQKN